MLNSKSRVMPAAIVIAALSSAAHAEMSEEELAKLAQNPVGNLISLPFQNNTNFNFGPLQRYSEHLEHPAGDPDLGERGMEHHHAHDRADRLESVAGAG